MKYKKRYLIYTLHQPLRILIAIVSAIVHTTKAKIVKVIVVHEAIVHSTFEISFGELPACAVVVAVVA